MSAESHVLELRKKHHALAEKIEVEQRAPGSDDLSIAELKRQKLRLKDEINKFSGLH